MKKPAFLLALIFLFPALSFCQEWELAKEKNGITVYTRKIEGEVLKEYRAELIVNASAGEVVDFFSNVDNNPLWMNHVRSSRLLKQESENEFYYYAEIDVPWPMTDRDMIVHVEIEPTDSGYICHLSNAPEFIPSEEAFVRIPDFRGTFTVIQVGARQVKVIEQSFTSPGGGVPAWLANSTVTDGPIKSLGKLKALVESP